jgi:aerobic carbon-monoxide dehydrogenase small subunit
MNDIATKKKITLKVNGKNYEVNTLPMARLLDVLREDCGLTGSKEGCGEGECGACSVMFNGDLSNSCLIPAVQADGAEITTIEGIGTKENLHPIQESFLKNGGAQCGICTPGMVLASLELLKKNHNPSLEEIKHGLGGNLCRCTGYMAIFDSVAEAAKEMSK